MRLTEHFTKEEMEKSSTAIRLGISNICPTEFVPNMMRVAVHGEKIREHYLSPVKVTSCYRSPALNNAVGGSKTSAHSSASAMDCAVEGIGVLELCKWCAENIADYDQIIYEFGEDGWMHIGFTVGTPRKQLLTAVKENGKTVYKKGLIA